tara:strand:- start:76 stop:285 length:210 start_codon:yes stop_codon:yes gene_type:complete
MIDDFTLMEGKKNPKVIDLKIKNLEFAINSSEELIRAGKADTSTLIFLRKKIAESKQELELLYLIKNKV